VKPLQISLFMQNKPNFQNAQMNVSRVPTKDYAKRTLGQRGKNKPNSNPIQTQSNPIKANKTPKQTQYKPKQSQSNPNIIVPFFPSSAPPDGQIKSLLWPNNWLKYIEIISGVGLIWQCF